MRRRSARVEGAALRVVCERGASASRGRRRSTSARSGAASSEQLVDLGGDRLPLPLPRSRAAIASIASAIAVPRRPRPPRPPSPPPAAAGWLVTAPPRASSRDERRQVARRWRPRSRRKETVRATSAAGRPGALLDEGDLAAGPGTCARSRRAPPPRRRPGTRRRRTPSSSTPPASPVGTGGGGRGWGPGRERGRAAGSQGLPPGRGRPPSARRGLRRAGRRRLGGVGLRRVGSGACSRHQQGAWEGRVVTGS